MSTSGYRRPEDVAEVVDDGTVYLAPLPDGPILALEGTAALIWFTAREVAPGDLVVTVAERSGTDPDSVRADVEAFVDDLVRRRLLELLR